jgi:hypothetical protein
VNKDVALQRFSTAFDQAQDRKLTGEVKVVFENGQAVAITTSSTERFVAANAGTKNLERR